MSRHVLRGFIVLLLFAIIASIASAQPMRDPVGEYRQFLKAPTKDSKVSEYWAAIQFEMELGSYEIAAKFLRSLMTVKKPTGDELFALERQIGMAALLRLRSVPRWSTDAKVHATAVADVEALITQSTAAVRKSLNDPLRIRKYIALLFASPEEHQFALKELFQSGAAIVPYVLDEMKLSDAEKRGVLLAALRLMGPEVLPPLMAALDSDDTALKLDLIDLFVARASRSVAPYLWFLAASPKQPDRVREKARLALAYFSLPPEKISTDKRIMERELSKALGQLPSARDILTRLAERYYRHDVPFSDPAAVVIWRWDGKNVVSGWPGAPTVSASKAEEYYGVRFAGQALALDPTYQTAQTLLVSLLLEKTYEQGGLDRPLAKADPDVYATVASINPDVLIGVLERALDEKRVPLILAATRTLGELAEVRATRPTEKADPALARALLFPDRRVQMAAVEALLRVPGERSALTAARMVEVLRRAVAAESAGAPKVLIGYSNDEFANKVVDTVKSAGFEPIVVKTGRELLKRVLAASDIEAVIFDADLPDPGLSSLLGQLRGDVHASRLPLFITPPHQKQDRLLGELRQIDDQIKVAGPGAKPALFLRHDQLEAELTLQTMDDLAAIERFAKVYHHLFPVTTSTVLNVKNLQPALLAQLGVTVNPPLADAELRDYAEKAVRYLGRAAKGEVPHLDVSVAGDAVLRALSAKKLTPEGQVAAIEVVGRIPGRVAQTELLRVALDPDPKRPAPVRVAAASELVRHIQRNSPVLSEADVIALRDAYGKSMDPAYRAVLAQVFGALRPDARASGDILRGYQPKPPMGVVPMPEK